MSGAAPRLLLRLHTLAAAMRRHGSTVSGPDVGDACAAVAVLGDAALAERSTLYDVLCATLARSPRDEAALALLFPVVFSFALDGAEPAHSMEDLLIKRGMAPERARQLAAALCQQVDDDDPLGAWLAGDAERATEALRGFMDQLDLGHLNTPLQVGYYAGRLMALWGAERLEGQARVLAADDAERQALDGAVLESAQALRRTARRAMELELLLRSARTPRTGDLWERDLATLTAVELDSMRSAVRQLARRLRARIALRRKRARRGRLDARRTLRESAATDGLLVRPRMKRLRPDRPQLLVLCDVSDSVRGTSVFMLELVAALSDALRRTRSFVFVDSLTEVTELFRREPQHAAQAILEGRAVNLSANSDYGRMLRELWTRHRPLLGRRTTVVILGDGRSNYRPPEAHILQWVRRRVQRVLWLSPEQRATWGFGDSEMIRYARHADAIPGQRSPRDLAAALDRIAR